MTDGYRSLQSRVCVLASAGLKSFAGIDGAYVHVLFPRNAAAK